VLVSLPTGVNSHFLGEAGLYFSQDSEGGEEEGVFCSCVLGHRLLVCSR
jgi:hypothetical protein